MADTLSAVFDATLGALKLKHVTAGPPPAGMQGTLEKCLDGSELRVVITGLTSGSLTWNALTLLNSWVHYDAANYANAEYAKDAATGLVYVRGMIKNGTATAGTVLATLPAGYRPTKVQTFAIVADGAVEVIDIQTDGDIVLATAASSVWLSLTGIVFSVN